MGFNALPGLVKRVENNVTHLLAEDEYVYRVPANANKAVLPDRFVIDDVLELRLERARYDAHGVRYLLETPKNSEKTTYLESTGELTRDVAQVAPKPPRFAGLFSVVSRASSFMQDFFAAAVSPFVAMGLIITAALTLPKQPKP